MRYPSAHCVWFLSNISCSDRHFMFLCPLLCFAGAASRKILLLFAGRAYFFVAKHLRIAASCWDAQFYSHKGRRRHKLMRLLLLVFLTCGGACMYYVVMIIVLSFGHL